MTQMVQLLSGTMFWDCRNLTSIVIPSSVTSIGSSAFYNCTALTTVYYGGADATAWSGITIGSGNTELTNATIYYYSASQPSGSGNFWHYENGEPTKWENE